MEVWLPHLKQIFILDLKRKQVIFALDLSEALENENIYKIREINSNSACTLHSFSFSA